MPATVAGPRNEIEAMNVDRHRGDHRTTLKSSPPGQAESPGRRTDPGIGTASPDRNATARTQLERLFRQVAGIPHVIR